MPRLQKNLTIALTLIVVAGFFGVVSLNAAPRLEITMRLGHDQPAVTRLGPPVRVIGEGELQIIRQGPVYFDLRSLDWYDQAVVELEYRDQGLTLQQMGIQAGEGFSYRLQSPVERQTLADGWERSAYQFDLHNAYALKNVRRFLLDVQPTQRTGGELQLRSLRITLLR